jgi:hypothetical protein
LKLVFPFTLSSSHFTLSLWAVLECWFFSLLLSHCSNIVFNRSYSTRKIRCQCSCSAVMTIYVLCLHSEGPNSTPSETKYRWACSRLSPSRRLTGSFSNDKRNLWLHRFNWIVVVVVVVTSLALNLFFKGANPCTQSYWLLPTELKLNPDLLIIKSFIVIQTFQ